MKKKSYRWHKLAESIGEFKVAGNGMCEVSVGGKSVCIVVHQDKVAACASKCPHAGGILSDGYVDSLGNMVCPLHRYKFSLVNGRNVSGEGYYLVTYPVEMRPDGIFIGFEENKGFIW